MGMDGLMIESHIDPPNALTDISQQLTPKDLKKIIEGLTIKEHGTAASFLAKYRSGIDELDDQLLEILSKRMFISEQIGELKRKHQLAPYQPERWQGLLEDRIMKARSLRLDQGFIKKVFETIHMESIKRQE